MARMPRNQLLDLLFSLFREQPRWSIKPLRERTQQPEAYLKEVLTSIATLNRSGEYNGLWELNDVFAKDGVCHRPHGSLFSTKVMEQIKSENVPGSSSVPGGTSGDAAMDDYDDEEDEDDDMEEVS